jgi:hypothetical protein
MDHSTLGSAEVAGHISPVLLHVVADFDRRKISDLLVSRDEICRQ